MRWRAVKIKRRTGARGSDQTVGPSGFQRLGNISGSQHPSLPVSDHLRPSTKAFSSPPAIQQRWICIAHSPKTLRTYTNKCRTDSTLTTPVLIWTKATYRILAPTVTIPVWTDIQPCRVINLTHLFAHPQDQTLDHYRIHTGWLSRNLGHSPDPHHRVEQTRSFLNTTPRAQAEHQLHQLGGWEAKNPFLQVKALSDCPQYP